MSKESKEAAENFPEENIPPPDEVIPAGDVGLEELALQEGFQMDEMERRELLVNPSDLQDPGDPESGDVGVVGGVAAGEGMGMGWNPELNPATGQEIAGIGGAGAIEGEVGELEDEKE